MLSRKVPKQAGTMITVAAVSLIAHLMNYYLSFLAVEISTALSAIVVGICGNLFTVFTNSPPVVIVGVAILMLSPGSLSYRGMASLIMFNSAQSNMLFFVDVFLIGIAIFSKYC